MIGIAKTMDAVEKIEQAYCDLTYGHITLGEYEELVKPFRNVLPIPEDVTNSDAISLNNRVELPKDEVVYGYISKQFPTTNVFFDSYETALNSAKRDQPTHRPFYMIKATRHFEFCGIVEKADQAESEE